MKRFICLSLAIVSVLIMGSCKSGCGKNNGSKEDTPLLLSSQELDKIFNPFFASSAPDSQIVGMTQIGMLGNDAKGNITYGKDEAVAALDVQSVYDEFEDTTTYYIVLKNNVKFSNGSPLTIKDVLFNLYVYLDPVYTGSSTIYSTDIVGLKEYRTQQGDEKSQERFMEQFQIEASSRIDYLATAAEYIYDDKKDYAYSLDEFKDALVEYSEDEGFEHIVEDFDKVLELFKEELETDYKNSSDGAYKSVTFKDANGTTHYNKLTTDVEMFLYNEGYLYWNKNEARLESSLTNNVNELKNWKKDDAIKTIYEDKIPMSLIEVVYYWNTASKLYDYLVNLALENYHKTHERTYTNISGISFINKESSVTVNGKTYQAPTYDKDGSVNNGSNEVLAITINGVDPKAIWNFAFSVAPMYYYSEQKYIEKFDFVSNFGVEYSSQSFMDKVIKNPDKIGVPVGAGPYAACNQSHSTENVRGGDFLNNNVVYFVRNEHYIGGVPEIKYLHYQVIPSNGLLNALYNKEVDYVQPNSSPKVIEELNGKKDAGIENKSVETSGYGYIGINAGFVPDIKVRQAIMHSIDTGMTVNYYGNTASAIYRSMSLTSWAYPDGATAYYPYIGGPVPANLDVVNPDYADYCDELNKSTGDYFTKEEQQEFIIRLVEDSGYRVGGDGVYTNGTTKLKYTFTIAGSETDHPAFNAFFKASEFLNEINFEINVATDAQALSKLASGGLAVWAAAWSSTIDPDMYQVYHKDSTASSTLNWGYKQIKQNTGGKYGEEQALVEELSELIDAGRETTDQDTRAIIYSQALDIVMQLAIELPTYQRDDLFAYNINKIDSSSLNADLSPYSGLLSDIHKVRLNLTK
ncbi:MAG: hypothetical protein IKT40_10070 [Bacilli bacterium]|nr:hypothetical protein [Bacilli bacterium]